jgi:hypothetical protein
MKPTNASRACALIAACLLAFFASGCNLFRTQVLATTVTISLSATGDYVAPASRTVMPSTNPDISSYELLGAKTGETKTSLKTWTSLTAASLSLETGNWDFTLVAKNSSGNGILSGSLDNVAISTSSSALSFLLEPLGSGVGTVNVTLTWPSGVAVSSVVPVFNGATQSALTQTVNNGSTSVSYSASNIERGNYLLTFKLNDGSSNLLASVTEMVRVYPNMESSKTIALATTDFNSVPTAPSNVSATHLASTDTTGSVTVTWTDNSNNETGFVISDGTNTWTADAAATSATITSLARGQSYTFSVRAVNSFGSLEGVSAASYIVPAGFITITYNANGGSGTMGNQVIESGTSVTLSANTFASASYSFQGWSISSNATSFAYADAATLASVTSDLTLYAVWATPASDLSYTVSNGAVTITKYNGTATTVIIPSMIGGYPVTRLYSASTYSSGVFYNKAALTSVIIPDSVTSIGNYAFYSCANLASVSIPSSVTSIGSYAFDNCGNLASVTIPPSMTIIGSNSFENCYKLASVTIPSTVTSIGSYAFQYCRSLASITIPLSVTSIGSYAFSGCDKLTSVAIPSSVTSIGEASFASCASLTSITVDNANTFYTSVDGILFNKAITALICYPAARSGSYTIPSTVTSIAKSAFSSCRGLTSLVIPSSVTNMGSQVFMYCTSLTSITIPSLVTSIGDNEFYCCTSLASITIPSSVTRIGYGVFVGCTSLTSINIPSSVTSIDGATFYNCSNLTSVTIPSAVTSIGEKEFCNCTSLTSVTIPSAVTSIGSSAFDNCTKLPSITIPSSVTTIGQSAFSNCTSLSSVTIPSSVTFIGDNAFYKCSGLTSVTIPISVTIIGNWAFEYCTGLTSIVIPSAVTLIGDYMLYGCTNLNLITVNAVAPPRLNGSSAFDSNKSGRIIKVPSASVDAYKAATYWSEYASSVVSQ